ncbi:MAG: ATP-binding cassette domain-containing protein [Burkholderiales bacterium]|nr:ATP-binding cassette domain-containing protein [Burkholderiales bacterium]
MLRVIDISKSFGGASRRSVLNAVSLDVSAGEYIAVMGESGVGKSTLLNIIAGLEAPDTGEVVLGGVNVTALADNELTRLRREHMGFVFQAFHVLPYLSVAQNVELPLALLQTDRISMRERVWQMLGAVGLGERGDSMPHELSGGELQRVAIARALVHRPKVVLADEPTGNLDPDTAGQILFLLKSQINENHASGILVTHSPDAARTADKIFRLTPVGLVRVE